MQTNGWRTLVVRSGEKVSLRSGCVVVAGEGSAEIPVEELSICVVENYMASVSIPLLHTLVRSGVTVILCDEKHTPFCEIAAVGTHHETAGRIMDQAAWTQERKDDIWSEIVSQKIGMQLELLSLRGKHLPVIGGVWDSIPPGDPENSEGQFARLYFRQLFGHRFIRHASDDRNAALDYGYCLLRSTIDRLIYSYGYHTALGIHHCGRNNRFNLSCDLMEPFRPFVDACVSKSRHFSLDADGRKTLLNVLSEPCSYGGRIYTVSDAMDCFVLDVLRAMKDTKHSIKEVHFA